MRLYGLCESVNTACFQTQGHSDYQERRKYKYDKQLESRIMLNKDGFDEGADARDWQRH